MFKYKINKTVTFGLLDKKNIFVKTLNKEIKIDFLGKKYEFTLGDKKVKKFNKQNKKDENEEILYGGNIKNIIELLNNIKNIFEVIFGYEKYHNFNFEKIFQLQERKKLKRIRIPEKSLNQKIYSKYEKQFDNLRKNIITLENYLDQEEHTLSRISHITRTIRYLQNDIDKLFIFIKNYQYFCEDKNNKKEKIHEIKEIIEKNTINDENQIIQLLEFYSKKSNNTFLEYKIALNPAILNTHTEINKKYHSNLLEELHNEVIKLDEENKDNRKLKRDFEDELEGYINHVLYSKNFFKESENQKYKEDTKKIYEKYEEYILKNEKGKEKHEEYVLDFLKQNGLINYIERKKPIGIEKDYLGKLLNQAEAIHDFKIFFKKEEIKMSLIQLKTLLYHLTWKRAEIKDKNKTNNLINDYSKLSEYITTVKKEINSRKRNKEINSRKRNKETLYGKFIAIDGCKSKIAQQFSQKYQELSQKQNFDAELESYTHFGFLIQKGNRFFILPFKKEDILNTNGGFTENDSYNLLEKYKSTAGEYITYTFKTVTFKALNKLIFIKDAFGYFKNKKDDPIYKIWKEKSYLPRKKKKKEDEHKYLKEKIRRKKNLHNYIAFIINILNDKEGLKSKDLFNGIDFSFKNPYKYNSIQEFERDFLKNSYKIEAFNTSFNEEDLIELNIVDRAFEFEKEKEKNIKLKRQNDIKLFVKGFFENINKNTDIFNIIRLVPEIKLYIRYKLSHGNPEIETRGKRKVEKNKRFYRDILKASFLFELNPLSIGQNIKEEREEGLKKILDKKSDNDFNIISIDIGEKEFATLGVYDKNLQPKDIIVNGSPKKIINLTDLKMNNGEIISQVQKNNISNKEKYDAFKYIFHQIILWQMNLKEILEEIGEIEIKKEKYGDIKQKISHSIGKIEGIGNFDNNYYTKVSKFFPNIEKGLHNFMFNYIITKEGKTIKLLDYYHELFSLLELQKVINFKDAFGANFIGIIKHILKQNKGIIVFESIHVGETYNGFNDVTKQKLVHITSEKSKQIRTLGTYIGMYILKFLFNNFTKDIEYLENGININQYVYLDKNYENSIGIDGKFGSNGILFFVNEYNTSSACPCCNIELCEKEEAGVFKDIELPWSKKLFGHLTPWENTMHHYSPNNGIDYGDKLEAAKKTYNPDCDYNKKKNKDFDFIKSGDDLAIYNIAKKGKEYLTFLILKNKLLSKPKK